MKNKFLDFTIGITLCISIALCGQYFSKYFGTKILQFDKSPISPIFIAIVIGCFLGNTSRIGDMCNLGISFCIKYILKFGIILMGIRLGLNEIIAFGVKGLLVVTPCILLTLVLVEKSRVYFRLSSNLATLIAVGTSICGATAIVATAPAINARKEEIAYAIANISIFGIFAMVIYPFVAHYFFPTNPVFAGLFLGSSIHETGQVAGAGMIYSDQYLSPKVFDVSTVTKLVRNTAMIIVIPYLSFKYTRGVGTKNSFGRRLYQIFPFFIFGFLFFGLLRTFGDYSLENSNKVFGLLNPDLWSWLVLKINMFSKFFLTIAMSAIGISTDLKKLKLIGAHVFYYGFVIALFVGIISLISIKLLFG